MKNNIIITQIKSKIGCLPKHKAILKALGLKHIGHTIIKSNNKSIKGMIFKIKYLLKIKKYDY